MPRAGTQDSIFAGPKPAFIFDNSSVGYYWSNVEAGNSDSHNGGTRDIVSDILGCERKVRLTMKILGCAGIDLICLLTLWSSADRRDGVESSLLEVLRLDNS